LPVRTSHVISAGHGTSLIKGHFDLKIGSLPKIKLIPSFGFNQLYGVFVLRVVKIIRSYCIKKMQVIRSYCIKKMWVIRTFCFKKMQVIRTFDPSTSICVLVYLWIHLNIIQTKNACVFLYTVYCMNVCILHISPHICHL